MVTFDPSAILERLSSNDSARGLQGPEYVPVATCKRSAFRIRWNILVVNDDLNTPVIGAHQTLTIAHGLDQFQIARGVAPDVTRIEDGQSKQRAQTRNGFPKIST